METPPQAVSPDLFPISSAPGRAEQHAHLSAFLKGINPRNSARDPKSVAAAIPILEAPPEARIQYVTAALERIGWLEGQYAGFVLAELDPDLPAEELEQPYIRCFQQACAAELRLLVQTLLSRQLPFTWENVREILDQVTCPARQPLFAWERPPAPGLVPMLMKQVEKRLKTQPLEPEVREALQRLRAGLFEIRYYAGYAKSVDRMDELLGGAAEGLPLGGEPWTDALLADVAAMPGEEGADWRALLAHAPVANKNEPGDKWVAQARVLLGKVGVDTFSTHVKEWLDQVGRAAGARINDRTGDYLKGLFWYCSLTEQPSLAGPIARAAEHCFKKLPDGGLYASKPGKCGLYALERLPGSEPVAQLARLKLRVRSPWALEEIGKSLQIAMERAGLTQEEVDELTIPTFGLDRDGRLRQAFGGYRVEIRVHGTSVIWAWTDAAGKSLKSAPAAVSREHGQELKELKRTAADLEKMLVAQRDRLERLLLTDHVWPLPQWRERYLDHPLLRTFTSRLIWYFREGNRTGLGLFSRPAPDAASAEVATVPAGTPEAEYPLDVNGCELDWISPDTEVRLWHPIGFSPETVLNWRVRLEEKEVRQPFKQAHREVYLLTDAELATSSYSNRFAGHILKQHQLAALCRERGWEYEYAGTWDGGETGARLHLPHCQLQAEYWVAGTGGAADVAESGVLLYVSTDQVRFSRDGVLVPLFEVPAPVFSEVMRDVDLFVGVSGVGSDPAWRDGGPGGAFNDYWYQASFGDLTASAGTRADLLGRLLPRLKLRDRCRLEGRFLIVRGDLRSYKIHLGSANILMEPNDQYLCIVPGRADTAHPQELFLPFEGDRTLSIVLSKAFLLAEDSKISDPSILSQIKR